MTGMRPEVTLSGNEISLLVIAAVTGVTIVAWGWCTLIRILRKPRPPRHRRTARLVEPVPDNWTLHCGCEYGIRSDGDPFYAPCSPRHDTTDRRARYRTPHGDVITAGYDHDLKLWDAEVFDDT